MPELPEIAALARFLTDHAGGQRVTAVTVTSPNVLQTYDPPASALVGRVLTGVTRHGKFLDIVTGRGGGRGADDARGDGAGGGGRGADDARGDGAGGGDEAGGLHLILHLARAGWLRFSDEMKPTPPRMGGPIALRILLSGGGGFDVTEAGTKKSVTAAVVADPAQVPAVERLGPDALGPDGSGMSAQQLSAALAGSTGRLKTVIADQTVIAGIGNAYSDEILHAAKLSPFATAGALDPLAINRLAAAMRDVLLDAIVRSVGGQAARLKGEKRSGLRVHARTGLPCPVCGDTIAEVAYSDRSFQYCPTCQTDGRILADRRRSRLLR